MARPVIARLLAFGPMVYGPTALFALGEGAVLPLIPVFASTLGGDLSAAALVSTALVIGQLCGSLPGGWAVTRIGERWAMVAASAVAMAGIAGVFFAGSIAWLAASVFVIGFCAAIFGLARHAFMTTRVSLALRARALSLLGGTFRLGMFAGPFVTALLLALWGDPRASLWFFLLCAATAGALVLFGRDPAPRVAVIAAPGPEAAPARAGVFPTIWRHRTVLGRLGLAAASLSALRVARQVALPLWGVSLGLDTQTIALVVGLSGAIDFALFYASGQVMDRFGRLWAALPAMLVMSLAFAGLALSHGVANSAGWYTVFAALLGLGNGLSSGILLTLGADVAPRDDPAPFLGAWRTLTDAGGAAAPLAMTALIAVSSLPIAVAAMAALGLAGAAGFGRYVPRYVPRRVPT